MWEAYLNIITKYLSVLPLCMKTCISFYLFFSNWGHGNLEYIWSKTTFLWESIYKFKIGWYYKYSQPL